jgi:hypothetical protein
MSAKKYLYAAVGAQVAVAKSAQSMVEKIVSKVSENATSRSSDLKGRIDVWAGEGEQFLGKVTDAKALDDLTSKVDFDQVQTQVNKLRDQLEDIMATWRSNFRPEQAEKVKVEATAAPQAQAKPAAKPAAKSTARTTATKKPAAKTATAKTAAAKKPAAKKPAAKTTTAKASEAKKAS